MADKYSIYFNKVVYNIVMNIINKYFVFCPSLLSIFNILYVNMLVVVLCFLKSFSYKYDII